MPQASFWMLGMRRGLGWGWVRTQEGPAYGLGDELKKQDKIQALIKLKDMTT